MAVTEAMPARGMLMLMAPTQKHIPVRVGTLPEGMLVVVSPTWAPFILAVFPEGNTPQLISMPASTPRRG